MAIQIYLDVENFSEEMEKWLLSQGAEPVEIMRFGEPVKSMHFGSCKPFHFYWNKNDRRQVRMFFWRKDQGIPLLFMIQFPNTVYNHNMDSTYESQ